MVRSRDDRLSTSFLRFILIIFLFDSFNDIGGSYPFLSMNNLWDEMRFCELEDSSKAAGGKEENGYYIFT